MKSLVAAALISTSLTAFAAFEGDSKPGWKTDADGNLEKDADGNPIYVKSDGAETTVNGTTISRLNGEAKDFRTRAEKAEGELAEVKTKFEGIDPDKAKEAIEVVSKIDQKTLVDAGKIDEVKAEISKGFQTQIAEKDKTIEGLQGTLNNTLISHQFGQSKFVSEKLAIPSEMVQSHFGKHFTIDENNKITAKGADGNAVYSKKNMGEIADFDEALEIIIGDYPNRDNILKGDNQSGTGNGGGGGNGAPNVNTMTRSVFATKSPADQAEFSAKVRDGKAKIIDG